MIIRDAYVCEKCGMAFNSRDECARHEEAHRWDEWLAQSSSYREFEKIPVTLTFNLEKTIGRTKRC